MTSLQYSRLAGFFYLVIIACGLFSELGVRARLVIDGDAATTAANIMASEGLFRLAIASDVSMLISDVVVCVLLYVLFRPVDRTVSMLAALFRLAMTAVLAANLLNHFVPLLLLSGGDQLSQYPVEQLQAMALLFMDLHGFGYDLGLIFFGLHCVVLAWLIHKDDRVPSLLAYMLVAAGAVYLVGSFSLLLMPDIAEALMPAYIVPLIAELSFSLWLLVVGIRQAPESVRI